MKKKTDRWAARYKKSYMRAYNREYVLKNRERLLLHRQAYRRANREKIREKDRHYYQNNKPAILRRQAARWRTRGAPGPLFILKRRLRRRYANEMKRNGLKPEKSQSDGILMLGMPITDFAKYIESKFKPGMSWSNTPEWHIDHIKPLTDFDMSDLGQRAAAFHYTNTQPLWAEENRLKYAGEKGRGRRKRAKND